MISVVRWWALGGLFCLAAAALNDGLTGIKFAILFCGMAYTIIEMAKELP